MRNTLLISTAIVGLTLAGSAKALELGDWFMPGAPGYDPNEVYNIDSQEDTKANSITLKENVTLGIKGTKVDITDEDGGTGKFIMSDTATLNMEGSEITAAGIETTGGTANLNGNSITADFMDFKNTTLNFSGNTNTLRTPVLNIENTTVNVKTAGALDIRGKNQTINASGTNTVNTKDGGIGLLHATLNVGENSSLGIVDTSGDAPDKGSIFMDITDAESQTVINNSGTINANLVGNADTGLMVTNTEVNMDTAQSKIDGDVDNVNLYFNNAHSLKSAVTGDIDAAQIMVSNGGSLTADRAFKANDLVLGSKSGAVGNLVLQADAEVGGAKVNKGSTLDLGQKTLTISGGQFQGNDFARFMDGSTLAFYYDGSKGGQIAGNVNLEGKVNLKPTIALGTADGTHNFITDGNISYIDKTVSNTETYGKEIDADKVGWVLAQDNNLYNLAVGEDNKSLIVEQKAGDEIAASTGANSNQANAVQAVLAGGKAPAENTAFNNVASTATALLQSDNPEEVAAGLKVVDQLSVDTSSFAQSTMVAHNTQIANVVGTRLSGGLSAAQQGMSSGDTPFENGAVWAQGLINKTELDKKVNGFDADSYGFAGGAEKQVTDAVKVGVGYAYTNTDIDTDNRKTDVDTHSAIVYGEYKPADWYINGIANYSWGDYDEKNSVKNASYDVDSFGLQAMAGYDMLVGGVNVTPEAGLRYVNINQKSYTDSMGNHVSGNKSDILTGVIGAKAGKDFALENGMSLRPEARVAMTYDLTNDDANSVVTLANGAAYSVEGEALDRFGVEVGASLTADVNDDVEMSVGYEGRFREDYTDHSGLLNAKYKF